METIGQRATAIRDNEEPSKRTGTNEFINVNINRACDAIAIMREIITQKTLRPVRSTRAPNMGDVITVTKKNKLFFTERNIR